MRFTKLALVLGLFSSIAIAEENKADKESEISLPDASEFSLSIDESEIPDNIKELLNTDSLPQMTAEMALQYLLQIAPEKPEWIYAKKMLEEKVRAAASRKVKKYKEVINTTIIPYGAQFVEEKISLEPFKFSSISFIDAGGSPWPVLSVKPSNNAFSVLGESELPDANKLAPNTIVIRSLQDYSEANLIVYLAGYQYPLLIKLETGSDTVEPVRNLKVMASAPLENNGALKNVSKETPLFSSAELRAFLIEPPSNAVIIPVKGDGVDVYKLEDDYFVVTRFQINVPYQEVEHGNGGLRVYKVVSESMLDTLTFTHQGKLISFDVMMEG